MEVKAWKEKVTIPTYEIGEAEKNPVFLENRVYQGSSGKVYPFQVVEKISDTKTDKIWQAVYLENKYVKIMILPELGGRVQMAYDKIKKRHFVYYNQVIKPALVGLTGPWISGGIEFNWPQHHRPSTYSPVEYDIEEHEDGSKTVWCSEIERMSRTKGMAGFTLYPDKAFMEIKVKLYNRTDMAQTFLWWANPAVKVNDDYQSVFPPDVNAVFDHGKRDVSEFPIAKGTYYKVDYSPGTDISKYKNIPVPTSYMAVNSKHNFVGGYENDSKGGLLHVADHHVSPGKKQWTWGNGEFGKAWDKNLTDEDGPYIELMCGVYTDNQPDFSWLQPYEEKSFSQYFMPYRDIGMVKNATREALLNVEFNDDKVEIKIFTLGIYPKACVQLEAEGKILFKEVFDANPEGSYKKVIAIDPKLPEHSFKLSLFDSNKRIIVSYQPNETEKNILPKPAKEAREPNEISSVEQLYLRGLHLEQYRHATYNPVDYYIEGLKREPSDIRCNNAMGLWLMRMGQFAKAEPYFRKAIETLTERNPNPYDGEPYYNLGLCLNYQGRREEAYSAFYKSTWNAAWQDAAYFNLAQLAGIKRDYDGGLQLVQKSLDRNWNHHKARTLKIAFLRVLGDKINAIKVSEESLKIDRFNFGALYEKYLLLKQDSDLLLLKKLISSNHHSYIEFALDYVAAGFYQEAIDLVEIAMEQTEVDPMLYYYCGWFEAQRGADDLALHWFKKGSERKADGCFAYRLEAICALEMAISYNAIDAMALYHLGNLWYDKKQYTEAMQSWAKSREINPEFATVRRNLALAYFNKADQTDKALFELETAFKLNKNDARVLMELDQLYKRLNHPIKDRLQLLESYPELVVSRDDLYLERCTLYNELGNYEKALSQLMERQFHPWEGGEGKVTRQFVYALVELAKESIVQKKFILAIELLIKSENYPDNLGEGKLEGARENDINYWLGCAYDGLNQPENAMKYWQKASEGTYEPALAFFYNDQQPDKLFYQGLALLKLNRKQEAFDCFNRLKNYGENHIKDQVKLDYFAVSLPDLLIWDDNLNKRNEIQCYYLMGLGSLGLNELMNAQELFKKVISIDVNHSGARIHKKFKYN